MTVAILSATPEGIPELARCECGAKWVRSAGDPSGETLPLFERRHRHEELPTAGEVIPLERCKQSGVLTMSRDAGERAPCPLCGRSLVIGADFRWPRHRRPVTEQLALFDQ